MKSTECLEKAASVSKANGQSKNEAYCYSDLGDVYNETDQYEKSIKYHEKALLIAKEKGHTNMIGTC